MKRLRAPGLENTRLKKLVADRDLELDVMKEIAAKNGKRAQARRDQVQFTVHRGLSQRRACALVQVS